jgi:hypothetical protein
LIAPSAFSPHTTQQADLQLLFVRFQENIMRTSGIFLAIWSLVAFSLLALDGCGSGNGTPPGPVFSETRSYESLEYRVEADKAVYAPGETMQLTLRITNTSAKTVIFQTVTTSFYRFRIARPETAPEGHDFPPRFPGSDSQLLFAPGETRLFRYSWNFDLTRGRVTPGGTYFITAHFLLFPLNITLPPEQLSTPTIAVELNAPCRQDPLFAVPGEVLIGIRTADNNDQELTRYIEQIGTITDRDEFGENAGIDVTLKSDSCIADAIAYLEANPKIRYATPNGTGKIGGG